MGTPNEVSMKTPQVCSDYTKSRHVTINVFKKFFHHISSKTLNENIVDKIVLDQKIHATIISFGSHLLTSSNPSRNTPAETQPNPS